MTAKNEKLLSPYGVDNPVRAKQRVRLARLDDMKDSINALFNPTELRISIGVTIGELNPVGWSHPVLMYGSTGAVDIPLAFHFSQFMIWHEGYQFPSVYEAMAWFAACGYADKKGKSPSPLILIWPRNVTMSIVVGRIDLGVSRWDKDLRIRLAEVTLQCKEIRQSFRTSSTVAALGFGTSDEGHTPSSPGSGFRPGLTGQPLNLIGGRKKTR